MVAAFGIPRRRFKHPLHRPPATIMPPWRPLIFLPMRWRLSAAYRYYRSALHKHYLYLRGFAYYSYMSKGALSGNAARNRIATPKGFQGTRSNPRGAYLRANSGPLPTVINRLIPLPPASPLSLPFYPLLEFPSLS